MFTALRLRGIIVAVLAAIVLPVMPLAAFGEDAAVSNPALLAAVVSAGGGADHFSAAAFRRALSTSPDEEKNLRAAVGTANVDRFDDVFTFVVDDALATMKRSGHTLRPPMSTDPKTIAAALYKAGLSGATFDIERCFDTLFSPPVHDHAMLAVGRKYGAAGETAYHTVFARLVQDTGKP